jgi:hypothetical protein
MAEIEADDGEGAIGGSSILTVEGSQDDENVM